MERFFKNSQTGRQSRPSSLWSDLVSVLPALNLNNRLDVRVQYKAYQQKKLTRRGFLSVLASAVREYDGPGVQASKRQAFADRLSAHPCRSLHQLAMGVEMFVAWCDAHNIVLVDM